jgi:hypothetical protein
VSASDTAPIRDLGFLLTIRESQPNLVDQCGRVRLVEVVTFGLVPMIHLERSVGFGLMGKREGFEHLSGWLESRVLHFYQSV